METLELLPQLSRLSHSDKLYIMQFLVSELAREQTDLLKSNLSYPIWSPYDAFDAADAMLQVIKDAKDNEA